MTREELTNFWTAVVEVVLSAFVCVRAEFKERVNDAKTAEEKSEVFSDMRKAIVEKILSCSSAEDLAKMGEV